ncbi:response regulator receiver domain [Psychrobacter alimentarius]|uniref:response regulator receiver domain n=1 Tax=Psychrobacter alimentarius TaxID=261164 RepID=UPI0019197100|nr:response regulator receiver domain [Psychrobacter alimentarius]
MTVAYKEKIVETFRNNAIRSVLLIDDEYLPYKDLVENKKVVSEKLGELPEIETQNLSELKIKIDELNKLNRAIERSNVAKDFINFFHQSKLICDVESDTSNLDYEKIRKSDLVVLDYYLKPINQDNRAESSLELAYQLSYSKHMNMVVIYTNELLPSVWLEVASTLRGSRRVLDIETITTKEYVVKKWEDNYLEWIDLWENFVTEEMKSHFILDKIDLRKINKDFSEFCDESDLEKTCQEHIKLLLENSINKLNLNSTEYTQRHIHGERGLWIQAGDVFIILCSKTDDDSPEDVWESISTALRNWNPSFYRVVTSDLQNRIEDANLSMEKSISYLDKDQMAFLWGILQSEDKNKERVARELLGNIVNEALDGILYDSNFAADVVKTAQSVTDPIIPYVERNKHSLVLYKDFQTKILNASARNVNNEKLNPEDLYLIAHSYNEKLSTTKHFQKYITTGSILKDAGNSWYICVSPSCNTIPNQDTDLGISALKPHRALTLARLVKVTHITEALHNAHHSSYIYVTSPDNEQLAFSVLNLESKLPELVKIVIKNHDDESWSNDGRDYKEMITFETQLDDNGFPEVIQKIENIYPISLLKPAYAARYQSIQSHYEGRIGVDYITLDLSEPEEPTDKTTED